MLKQILTGSTICALLLCASLSPAQAGERQGQAQQPGAAPTTPAQAPNQTTTPPSPGTAQGGQVSQQELRQFANAIKELRGIQSEAQTQANQVVQRSGLSSERFAQLLQSQQPAPAQAGGGQATPSAPAQTTPEERQRFEQAMTQMEQLQQETIKKMEAAVQSQGLPIDRFNQIMALARQNPEVRQQVQQLLQ